MYQQPSKLILASASPRRRDLLTELGISFDCAPTNIDETVMPNEDPKDLAQRLALSKAEAGAKLFPDRFVLGADTDVAIDGMILGKPNDAADAERLLSIISGRTHVVWGGCALVNFSRFISTVIVSSTLVTMRTITPEEIKRYVATGEPMDKAGAYAVQGIGSQFIAHIEGSYPNIVGLDTPRVMDLLKQHGVIN